MFDSKEANEFFTEEIAQKFFGFFDEASLNNGVRVSKTWRNLILKNFAHVFKNSVKRYPTQIALSSYNQEKKYTYEELNHDVNRLASLLGKYPAQTSIGLFLPPSYEFVVSLLAIFKANMVYVPLSTNPEIIEQRLLDYVSGSAIKLIITHSHFLNRTFLSHPLLDANLDKLVLDKSEALLNKFSDKNPDNQTQPEHVAYNLNTSGSTGKPKKILIKHAGLVYALQTHQEALQLTRDDKIAAFADISFDASLMEVMMALGSGATLYPVPFEKRNDPVKLTHFYQTHNISVAIFTPSMLQMFEAKNFPDLRVLISTGEKVSDSLIKKWLEANPTLLLVDGYGPAEVTIATFLKVYRYDHAAKTLTCKQIPIKGLKIFVLKTDPDNPSVLTKADVDEEGEIYITGYGLAKGYTDEKLTQERFITLKHPENPNLHVRAYRTFDAARLDHNGNIKLIGRIDRQVKIYGKLMAPEETDAAILEADDNIAQAYVDTQFHANGHPNFIAYLELRDKTKTLDLNKIYRNITKKLPTGMIPARWVTVDKIALNSSKKIDKTNTPAFNQQDIKRIQGYSRLSPQDELEKALATLWHSILQIDENFVFNMDDNFIALGGTSLQIADLLQQLRYRYNLKLTLAEFIQDPALGHLARKIRRLEKKDTLKKILHLHEANSSDNAPLFLIHSLLGDAERDYEKLKSHLAFDRSVYAISARGLADAKDMDDNLYTIARDYIAAIKKINPHGPFLLAGWSAGGIIGLVMLELLRAEGKEAWLLMIDSEAIDLYQQKDNQAYAEYLFDLFAKKLLGLFNIHQELPITITELAHAVPEQQIYSFWQVINSIIDESKKPQLTAVCSILLAILRYSSDTVLEQVGLLVADKTREKCHSERLGWPERIQISYRTDLKGDHESILLDDKHVKNTAKLINDFCINKQKFLKIKEIKKRLKNYVPREIDSKENEYYIAVNGCLKNAQHLPKDLDKPEGAVTKFLTDTTHTQKVLLLLGNAGAGKTMYCQNLFLQKTKEIKEKQPIYLYINLTSYNDPEKELIEKYFRRAGLTKQQVDELKAQQTELVVIIDGYDEHQPGVYKNLYRSNNMYEWNAKVIFACRSSYIINAPDYRVYFEPTDGHEHLMNALTEITLVPFSDDQIDSYIKKYLNKTPDAPWKDWQKYRAYIDILPGLRNLISNPFLLRMLMEVLPTIISDNETKHSLQTIEITVSKLLDYFINSYFRRQKSKLLLNNNLPDDGTSIEKDFYLFSKRLALKMNQLKLSYATYAKKSDLFMDDDSDEELYEENKPGPFDKFFDNANKKMVRAREGCPIKPLPTDPEDNAEKIAFIHTLVQSYFVSKETFEASLKDELQQAAASFRPADTRVPVKKPKRNQSQSNQGFFNNQQATDSDSPEETDSHGYGSGDDEAASALSDEDPDLHLAVQLSLQK